MEKFFIQQTGAIYGVDNIPMIQAMGGRYEVVMTAAKLLAVAIEPLNGWLVQHTKSRQSRMRPWYLIFGFVSIILGGLIFLFPSGGGLGENCWYYFFFLVTCYNTIGFCFFYLFRDTIVSLTSRSPSEKLRLKFTRQVCWTLISGFLRQIGMLPHAYTFSTLLCYAYDNVEHKSGFRLEGMLDVAIIIALQSAVYAPFAGGFESGILQRGFVDVEGVTPNADLCTFSPKDRKE